MGESHADPGWWDRPRPPRWLPRALIELGLAVAAFLTIQALFVKLSSLLVTLLVSLFLSFAIEPAVNHLADRGWRRGRATIACFVLLFGVGGVFLTVMVSLVVSQVADLVEQAPTPARSRPSECHGYVQARRS